jgi:pantothenate kinase
LGKKHKELANLGPRCAQALKKILVECRDNEEQFKIEVDKKIDHYCGLHTYCDSNFKKRCSQLLLIADSNAKQDFLVK